MKKKLLVLSIAGTMALVCLPAYAADFTQSGFTPQIVKASKASKA